MRYLIWRIRCAQCFKRTLKCDWKYAWHLSGPALQLQRDMQGGDSDPLDAPQDAVDEELSYWGN